MPSAIAALSRRFDEALQADGPPPRRFEGLRRRARSSVFGSRFVIGPYVTYRLSSHDDLWSAVAASHITNRNSLAHPATSARVTPGTEQCISTCPLT